ncbi:hypothetical protein ACH5BK_05995 [Arcobacter sp. YIC-80]|uniref:hypothetical protein n=1 Tax=Arcobacter sp. YIC-80 TaxID=3376683 RepID=UPI00384EAAA8
MSYCKKNFSNCEKLTRKEISKKTVFIDEEFDIINKSLILANYLKENQLIDLSSISVEILSLNELNTIGDVKVNEKVFDINLTSIRLGNLEISKFLFLLTQTPKYNGKNIIETFAKEDLDITFRKGCDILIKELSENSYEARLTKVSYSKSIDKLYFFYQGQEFYIDDFSTISYDKFFNTIPSSYLKVFSDCFNERVKSNLEYIEEKNSCLLKVQDKIEKIIKNKPQNISLNNLLYSLFRFTMNSYYLMSLNNSNVECFNIPSRSEFNNKFNVSSINQEVKNGELILSIIIEDINNLNKYELKNIFDYHNGEFYQIPKIKSVIENDLILNIYDKK